MVIVKEKDKKDTKKEEAVNKDSENNEKRLLDEVAHWKNEYYRVYADMENLRKRVEAEHRQALKYRVEGFISDLLPILDGFHMALQHEPSSVEMKNFLTGFEFIYRNLVSVLENEGVQEINPSLECEFNPDSMQAVETVIDNEHPNVVKKVVTKGYKLHDRLIRPAMVVVSIAEEKKNDEANNENNKDVEIDA